MDHINPGQHSVYELAFDRTIVEDALKRAERVSEMNVSPALL